MCRLRCPDGAPGRHLHRHLPGPRLHLVDHTRGEPYHPPCSALNTTYEDLALTGSPRYSLHGSRCCIAAWQSL